MSTKIVDGLLYTKDDEWVQMDGDTATVGITDYAQDSLSDIVFLELPDEGDSFGLGETFGTIESVKAAADLYIPLSGEITAVNEDLIDTPELVNENPYGNWMIKIQISDSAELDGIMDAAAYKTFCDERD